MRTAASHSKSAALRQKAFSDRLRDVFAAMRWLAAGISRTSPDTNGCFSDDLRQIGRVRDGGRLSERHGLPVDRNVSGAEAVGVL